MEYMCSEGEHEEKRNKEIDWNESDTNLNSHFAIQFFKRNLHEQVFINNIIMILHEVNLKPKVTLANKFKGKQVENYLTSKKFLGVK